MANTTYDTPASPIDGPPRTPPPQSPLPAVPGSRGPSMLPPPHPHQGFPQQPFYPYPPPPPPPVAAQTPHEAIYSRPWLIAKFALTALCILWSIIILGIALGLATYEPMSNWDFYGYGLVDLGLSIALIGLSLLWSIADSITLCVRRLRRGITPGAHVGMHLFIFLVGLAVIGWVATITAILPSYYDDNDSGPDRDEFERVYAHFAAMHNALLAFLVLLDLTHFVLFVRACVDTHRLRHARKTLGAGTVQYVYVQAPPQGQYAPVYQGQGQPMQMNTAPQMYGAGGEKSMAGAPGAAPARDDRATHGYYAPTGTAA